jgi:hypothetical protein
MSNSKKTDILNNNFLKTFLFAYDQIILTSEDSLQIFLHQLVVISARYNTGILIHASKQKYQCQGQRNNKGTDNNH